MKSVIVLSLASSALAVPFGSLLDSIFVERGEAPARREVPPEEILNSIGISYGNVPYNTGSSSSSGRPTPRPHPRKSTSNVNIYPTASGGAEYPDEPIESSMALSITYSLSPTSTVVEVPGDVETPAPTPPADIPDTPEPTPAPEVSTPLAEPEPVITPPVVGSPPEYSALPVITPPSLSAVPIPSNNPGIPTPGSPGMPIPGQPGLPTCGQAGMEWSCGGTGVPAPYPSATGAPADPWASYAGPDITPGVPGPTGGYPGYPGGTGAYGAPSTMTTWIKPEPTPVEEPVDDSEGEGEGYGSEKRGIWKRMEDEVKEALGYGGGRSEMSQ